MGSQLFPTGALDTHSDTYGRTVWLNPQTSSNVLGTIFEIKRDVLSKNPHQKRPRNPVPTLKKWDFWAFWGSRPPFYCRVTREKSLCEKKSQKIFFFFLCVDQYSILDRGSQMPQNGFPEIQGGGTSIRGGARPSWLGIGVLSGFWV